MAILALGLLWWANPVVAAEDKLQLAVSVEPLKGFVEKIGGDRVKVMSLAGKGVDPHSYEPKLKTLSALAGMDGFFTIGMPFETKLAPKLKKLAPKLKQFYLAAGAELLDGADHHHHEEDDDDDHHDHGGADPHLWLSPPMIKHMAKNIAKGLTAMDADGKALFAKNLAAFEKELDAKHAELTKMLAPMKGKSFYVDHPAFGYFAEAYGLVQKPIEIGGTDPNPKALQKLMKEVLKAKVKVIFTQPQFNPKTANSVARLIKGKVVPLDPLDGNVMGNLDLIAKSIRDALSSRK